MNQEEINKRNAALGLFAGGPLLESLILKTSGQPPIVSKDTVFVGRYPVTWFRFHTSWEWLMPVISKIGVLNDYPPQVKAGDWLVQTLDLSLKGALIRAAQVKEDGWSRRTLFYSSVPLSLKPEHVLECWYQATSDFCMEWAGEQLSMTAQNET